MAERNSSRFVFWALGMAVTMILGWFAFSTNNEPRPDPVLPIPKRDLDSDEAYKLLFLKNEAVANLENAELEQAQDLLSEIIERVPDQALGPVNLAIAKLLVLDPKFNPGNVTEEETPEKYQEAIAEAKTAVKALLIEWGDKTLPYLLAANLSQLERNESETILHLEQAIKLNPNSAVSWYQLFRSGQQSKNDDLKAKSVVALKKVFELAPENLVALTDLLKLQSEQVAPELVQTIESAKKILRPFQESVQKLYRQDLLKLLNDASAAVTKDDMSTARRNILGVINLIRGEVAFQIDQRRLSPHLLEYVINDFDQNFYKVFDSASDSESIEVSFMRASKGVRLPELPSIKCIQLADFDLDSRLDVILADEKKLSVYGYENTESGWKVIVEVSLPFTPTGILVADLDRDLLQNSSAQSGSNDEVITDSPKKNTATDAADAIHSKCLDADVDIIVYGTEGVLALKNQRDATTNERRLEPIQQEGLLAELKNVLAGLLADIDHDGDLDVILSSEVGMKLFLNQENFTFVDASANSNFPSEDVRPTTLLPVDYDRNVAIDILAGSATSPGWGVLENIFHGRFRWQPFDESFGSVGNVSDLAVIDVDKNASWDPIAAGTEGITLVKSKTASPGTVRAIATEKISDELVKGLKTFDFNNDGDLDLIAWNESELFLYQGNSAGQFEQVSDLIKSPPTQIMDCEIGDLDNDGDEDLIVVTVDRPILYLNKGGNTNHWIDITLRADQIDNKSQRCPIAGTGTLLELKSGTKYQPRVVSGQKTHFGLGGQHQADVIRVLWSNGIPQNLFNVKGNQTICAKQHLKGSCPYIYTWTGEKYEFFTDLLWAAPIGLQWGQWTPAPSRSWEYLKIPGDRLVEKDREYHLQITEELWEAGYFDSVKILAVDHPPDVEIFSNEKVGPAEIAEYKVHTVRQRRSPIAAFDQNGRNVLETVMKRDERYLKSFGNRIKQGLTPEHYLELNLGDLETPEQITLFLSGWVFPTDTSINIALSQNPELDLPRPPSIQVPDANGEWEEVIPYMGFPGGKTKTIAVELPGSVFHENDYRLRIVTSMELYWDEVFFSVDESDAPIQIQNMPLVAADLHFRGFSKRIAHPQHGPESYDYSSVSKVPHWPPMQGRFTRYGDITEIVREPDDRLVILGAGDEMTLRFMVEDPPPADDWKRDFLLYNVGWDKDADLNTIYGQTVEPLPFREMNGYPDIDGRLFPETPLHRSYLKTYQTRKQNWWQFWKHVRDFKPAIKNKK